jgi:soluble lytic murein transglycosylase
MKLAWLFLSWTLLLSSPAHALNIAVQNSDTLLQAALEAYKKQNEPALADYAQQLHDQDYILAPYADYWLMLLRLSQADNDSVRVFLDKYSSLPFADRVRGEWLKKLGRQQDWQTFFAELPNFHRDDTAVKCYSLYGQAELGNPQEMMEVLAEGKRLWAVTIDQPANCDALFDSMFSAKVLTESDVWSKLRMALVAGKITLAKTTAKRLKNFDQADAKLMDSVYQNPQRALQKRPVSVKSHYGRELNLYAFDRVARTQPDLAISLWQKSQPAFDASDRNYMWGRFALHAARKHDPRALEWFERANDMTLDKEQMAWRVRAALREHDWEAVSSAIAAMPNDQQDEGAWRYWKARALKAQQQLAAANAILAPLSLEQNYYGLLAQDELGDIISAQPVYYKASDEEVRAIMKLPAIQRALELHRLDMRGESRQEWAWAASNFDDKQLIAAAEVAFRSDWYDVAINTA